MPVLNIMLILLIVFVVILLLILSVRRHIAIKLALEAIAPRDISYGAVLSQEITRNHIDRSLMDLKYDKLFLKHARGQELIARLYLASAQTDHYVLFLHGYNYPWVGALKYLPMLLERRFNVLVPDQQAQGESQGDFITFGALESDDALEWLTQITRHARLNGFERARTGIMGESMGAVTALLAMEKANSPSVPLENKPLFCIADCPFSDWDSMMTLQFQKRSSLSPKLLLPLVKLIIKTKTGVDMSSISAVQAAKNIRVPVLLFHGTKDPLVPCSMSEEIAKANPNITFCPIEGAKHMNCYTTNPQEYCRQIDQLLTKVPFENQAAEEIAVYL